MIQGEIIRKPIDLIQRKWDPTSARSVAIAVHRLTEEEVEATEHGEEWYFSAFDQVFGPMTVDVLRGMAAGGSLCGNDRVKYGLHGNWFPARLILGAIEGFEFGERLPDEPDEPRYYRRLLPAKLAFLDREDEEFAVPDQSTYGRTAEADSFRDPEAIDVSFTPVDRRQYGRDSANVSVNQDAPARLNAKLAEIEAQLQQVKANLDKAETAQKYDPAKSAFSWMQPIIPPTSPPAEAKPTAWTSFDVDLDPSRIRLPQPSEKRPAGETPNSTASQPVSNDHALWSAVTPMVPGVCASKPATHDSVTLTTPGSISVQIAAPTGAPDNATAIPSGLTGSAGNPLVVPITLIPTAGGLSTASVANQVSATNAIPLPFLPTTTLSGANIFTAPTATTNAMSVSLASSSSVSLLKEERCSSLNSSIEEEDVLEDDESPLLEEQTDSAPQTEQQPAAASEPEAPVAEKQPHKVQEFTVATLSNREEVFGPPPAPKAAARKAERSPKPEPETDAKATAATPVAKTPPNSPPSGIVVGDSSIGQRRVVLADGEAAEKLAAQTSVPRKTETPTAEPTPQVKEAPVKRATAAEKTPAKPSAERPALEPEVVSNESEEKRRRKVISIELDEEEDLTLKADEEDLDDDQPLVPDLLNVPQEFPEYDFFNNRPARGWSQAKYPEAPQRRSPQLPLRLPDPSSPSMIQRQIELDKERDGAMTEDNESDVRTIAKHAIKNIYQRDYKEKKRRRLEAERLSRTNAFSAGQSLAQLKAPPASAPPSQPQPKAAPAARRPAHRSPGNSSKTGNVILGAVAAALLLFAGYWFWPSDASDRAAFEQLETYYEQFQRMTAADASDDLWQQFEKQLVDELQPVVQRLEEEATRKKPAKRQLLYAGRDYLPMMLQSRAEDPVSGQTEFEACMQAAAKILFPDENRFTQTATPGEQVAAL